MWMLLAFLVNQDSIPVQLTPAQRMPDTYTTRAKCVDAGDLWSYRYEDFAKDTNFRMKRLVYHCQLINKLPKPIQ